METTYWNWIKYIKGELKEISQLTKEEMEMGIRTLIEITIKKDKEIENLKKFNKIKI